MQNLKKRKLKIEAQKQIQMYIKENNLLSGDHIPTEKVLEEKLGISRTVIREALNGLEALGLLEAKSGVGRIITQFDFKTILNNVLPYSIEDNDKDVRDVMDIRAVLEINYLPLILEGLNQETLDQIRSAFERMTVELHNNNIEGITEAHKDFHCALYHQVENTLLLELIKIFLIIQNNYTLQIYRNKTERLSFIESHRQIMDSIERKDAELIQKSIVDHFSFKNSFLT